MVRVSLGLGSELWLGLGCNICLGLWLELTLPKTLTLTLDPNPQNGIVEGHPDLAGKYTLNFTTLLQRLSELALPSIEADCRVVCVPIDAE